MIIEVTEDTKEIVTLLTHSDIIKDITNDECLNLTVEDMEKGVKELLPLSLYLKVLTEDKKMVGLLSFHDEEGEALDIHCAFLKGFRGKFAISAIKKTIALVFKHTKYEKIWARFSSKKLDVLKISSYCGFKLEHLEEKNYPDQGIMYDTICMTLTKKDYKYA